MLSKLSPLANADGRGRFRLRASEVRNLGPEIDASQLAAVAVLTLLTVLVEEVVRRGFPHVARGAALLLARIATLICPSRRGEWMSEILNLQRQRKAMERTTGLWLATRFLINAPLIRVHEWRLRTKIENPQGLVDLPGGFVMVSVKEFITSPRRGCRVAGCCAPTNGDRIIAYRGERIHADTCPNMEVAKRLWPERIVPAIWAKSSLPALIKVQGSARSGADETAIRNAVLEAGWKVRTFSWLGRKHRGFEALIEADLPGVPRKFVAIKLARLGVRHVTVVGFSQVDVRYVSRRRDRSK